jgi:hypothetical protein
MQKPFGIFLAFLFLIPLLVCYPRGIQEEAAQTDKTAEIDLGKKLFEAINSRDLNLLKECIAQGADIQDRMLGGQGNTPLGELFNDKVWYNNNYQDNERLFELLAEMITILLEAGAVPQRWMLYDSYYRPDIVKILLEHGALVIPESHEWGHPSNNYYRTDSVLSYYCKSLPRKVRRGKDLQFHARIVESVALLLEHGANANDLDRYGTSPMILALYDPIHGLEMAKLFLKYTTRPLTPEECRYIIGLNRRMIYKEPNYRYRENGVDKEREDIFGFDALILEGIRNGFLNPAEKNRDRRDMFDYAAAYGTAGLMEGLLPYLLESERTIIASDGTGLYHDAIGANNFPVAAALSSVMSNTFGVTEYYTYDYETIYRYAQRIAEKTLYHSSGPGGMRIISENPKSMRYESDKNYTITDQHGNLLLYTVDGNITDLSAIINGELEQYYRKNGEEKPSERKPNWQVCNVVNDIYYVGDIRRDEDWFAALVDLSGKKPSVYFHKGNAPGNLFVTLWLARDIVINAQNIYTVGFWGEVTVFAVKDNFLQIEKSTSWKECSIPGWEGGERVIIDNKNGTVSAHDFASGTSRIWGQRIEHQWSYNTIFYQDADGRRFISERNGKSRPWLGEGYDFIESFDQGYIYADRTKNSIVICFFENDTLTRKIVLSCENIIPNSGYYSIAVYGDKLYLGMNYLACAIDLNTMQLIKAFNAADSGSDTPVFVFMFPFGEDDVVYTRFADGH